MSAQSPTTEASQQPITFPCNYSPGLIAEITEWGMPTFRTGSIIWKQRSGEQMKFLLVHERRVKKDGVWQDGDGGWNIPCGRVGIHPSEARFETLEEAARREVTEETGIAPENFQLHAIAYVGEQTDPNNPYLIILFSGTPDPAIPDVDEKFNPANFTPTAEIDQIRWFTYDEIDDIKTTGMLDGEPAYLRNATMTTKATFTILAGNPQWWVFPTTHPSKIPKLTRK